MKTKKIILILLIINLLLTSCQNTEFSSINEDTQKIDTETTQPEEINPENEGKIIAEKESDNINHDFINQETINNNIELENETNSINDIIGWAYDLKINNTEQIKSEVYKINDAYFSIEIYEYIYTKDSIDLSDKKVYDRPMLG